uniref:G_PROTEIN_RECEP_F1_2 domain-containing protein n=1 Tax=Panagrellus redivivus TaxID=6233 RepID=A0A7E4VSY9_PANRE
MWSSSVEVRTPTSVFTFVELPIHCLDILMNLLWMCDIAIDTVMHASIKLVKMSMAYVCLAVSASHIVFAINVIFNVFNSFQQLFLLLFLVAGVIQQSLHGILFLIDRWIATKHPKYYGRRFIAIISVLLILLTWIVCIILEVLNFMNIYSMAFHTLNMTGLEVILIVVCLT